MAFTANIDENEKGRVAALRLCLGGQVLESVSHSVVSDSLWLPGSSVHEILQSSILEWFAISFSRGSSQPRYRTQVSHTASRFFTVWATNRSPWGGKVCIWLRISSLTWNLNSYLSYDFGQFTSSPWASIFPSVKWADWTKITSKVCRVLWARVSMEASIDLNVRVSHSSKTQTNPSPCRAIRGRPLLPHVQDDRKPDPDSALYNWALRHNKGSAAA